MDCWSIFFKRWHEVERILVAIACNTGYFRNHFCTSVVLELIFTFKIFRNRLVLWKFLRLYAWLLTQSTIWFAVIWETVICICCNYVLQIAFWISPGFSKLLYDKLTYFGWIVFLFFHFERLGGFNRVFIKSSYHLFQSRLKFTGRITSGSSNLRRLVKL